MKLADLFKEAENELGRVKANSKVTELEVRATHIINQHSTHNQHTTHESTNLPHTH